MRVSFCHHLSLSYFGGGEKWIISAAKELVKRGYEVEICALSLLLDGKPKINPKEVLEDIPHSENYRNIAMLLHLLFTIVFFFYFFPVMMVR